MGGWGSLGKRRAAGFTMIWPGRLGIPQIEKGCRHAHIPRPPVCVHPPAEDGWLEREAALSPFANDPLAYGPNRWLDRCGIHVNYFAPWWHKRFRAHTPVAILHRELPPDAFAQLFTFAFVRNPWDLLVSSYHFLALSSAHRRGRLVRRLGSFEHYVDYELARGKLLQSRMLTSGHGRLLVDFVGRFESLASDFAQVCRHLGLTASLPHVNAGQSGDYRPRYTPALAARVADAFGEDVERFGYTFDSPAAPRVIKQAA